jgi:hypothetical protein
MTKNDPHAPDFYCSRFSRVPFHRLRRMGITSLIIDVDNTIALCGSPTADPECKEVITGLQKDPAPFKICLASNIIMGRKRVLRVKNIAGELGVPFVTASFWDRKPDPRPFLKALEILKSGIDETAVIGDQVFTDVLGGGRLGMTTVLVPPLGPDHWAVSLLGRRRKEAKILESLGIKINDEERQAGK